MKTEHRCSICNQNSVIYNDMAMGKVVYCCNNPICMEDFQDYIDNVPKEKQINFREKENPCQIS